MTQGSGQSSSNQEPNCSDKLADILLRAVTVGDISAGEIDAFWKLFTQSDSPQAVLSVVIGIGISYGAAILGLIHRDLDSSRAEGESHLNHFLIRLQGCFCRPGQNVHIERINGFSDPNFNQKSTKLWARPQETP